MLKILRKQKVAKKIFYLLAIIIVPAFVLWGSSSAIRNKTEKVYAGTMFGKKVSFEQYAYALQGWRTQLRLQYGEQAQQLEKFLDAKKAAWDRLLLTHEANKRKIKVSDAELSSYLTSLPLLQKDGVFDKQLYTLLLQYYLYMQPRMFEEHLRSTLMLEKLFKQVTNDVSVNDEEIRQAYLARSRQIKIHYIEVLAKDFEGDIHPSDEDLKSFLQDKQQLFSVPLQINLQSIGFDYPAEATEEQKEEIGQKAESLRDFLEENSNDLAAAQKKFSLEVKETGYFSVVEKIPGFDWMPKNFDLLFNLKENELSDIMETPRGPHLFLLKEKRTDYLPPFDTIKEQVYAELLKEKTHELAKARIEEVYLKIQEIKKTSPDASLKQIADQLKLSIKETDFFSQNAPIPNIESSRRLTSAAFALATNEISGVIDATNALYIIAVSEEKPFDEEEFTKVKNEVSEDLLEQKKNEAFADFATKLKAQANIVDLIPKDQTQALPRRLQ